MKMPVQHGGWKARFLSFFVALGFSRFDGESPLARHYPSQGAAQARAAGHRKQSYEAKLYKPKDNNVNADSGACHQCL